MPKIELFPNLTINPYVCQANPADTLEFFTNSNEEFFVTIDNQYFETAINANMVKKGSPLSSKIVDKPPNQQLSYKVDSGGNTTSVSAPPRIVISSTPSTKSLTSTL